MIKILEALSTIDESLFWDNHPDYPTLAVGRCLYYSEIISHYLWKEFNIHSEIIPGEENGEPDSLHYFVEIPGKFLIDATLCQKDWEVPKRKRTIPHIIIEEITPQNSFIFCKNTRKSKLGSINSFKNLI